jgi:hypothetical protein
MTRRRKPAAHDRPTRRAVARGPDARSVVDPNPRIVDLTRVVEARRRIASGWYDRSDVRDSLVEAMLQEMRSR